MNKLLPAALAVALVATPLIAEIVLFEEGFGTPTEGIYCDPTFPAGWVLHDEDGLTVDSSVSEFTDAWITLPDPLDGSLTNCAAASTSWYDPAGTADDWMVTPLIQVQEGAVLTWRAFTEDPDYQDGYGVRYSTTGTAVSDFLANPALFATPAEKLIWTEHSIALDGAGLGGRAVYFAFRNNTFDGVRLFVDDVKVAVDDVTYREEFGGTDSLGYCDPVFPAGWIRHDVDGLTPDASVAFVDQAWVAADVGISEPAECAAFSTSYYVPAGQADDWMVSPPLEIPVAAELRWRAAATTEGFEDGYEVRASTGGSNPGDFTTVLFSIAAESTEWTERSIDLDALGFGGQTIRIAFRNHSTDKNLLAVDRVEIALPVVFRDGFNGGYAGAWSGVLGLAP